ncbi:MAG: hypothetical protein ACRD2I_13560 [Vicinamibacterales bacterium]
MPSCSRAWIASQAAWPDNFGVRPLPSSHTTISFWWLPNALPLALVVIALVPLTTLLGTAYGLFVVGNMAPPLLRHGLLSAGRFSSVMFPVFAWLAVRVQAAARTRLIIAFGLAQAALFFTWHSIV